LRFPRPNRSFSRRHHEKGEKSETLLEGSFQLKNLKNSTLVGEYPRRVSIGDVLAHSGNQNILSPVNGIVNSVLEGENPYLIITQDGGIESPLEFKEFSPDLTAFLSVLEKNGLYSLDFDGIFLSEYFRKFQNVANSELVLSPFTKSQTPDFYKILSRDFPKEIQLLVELLGKIFPDKKVISYLESKSLKYRYPMGIPDYFVDQVAGYSLLGDEPKDQGRIFYLGGETIWHLIRGIFYDLAFTKRHLSVFCVDKNGSLDGKERNFLLSNGQSLQFLDRIFAKKYKYYSLDNFFSPSRILDKAEPHYFNIFEDSSIVFYMAKPKKHSELPCTECWECSYHCPTLANPIGLILSTETFFDSSCVYCGLCTVHCPSGIDLRKRILEWDGSHVS
jgi:ferredoxin